MAVYSIEVKLCATAYVRAKSAADALRQAVALAGKSPIILNAEGEVPVSGLPFADEDLPTVSLSPAMTIHGIWPDAQAERAD